MTFTQAEVGTIFYSLNIAKDGTQRKFAFSEHSKVNSLSAKLSPLPEGDKLTKPEYVLDLSTEEKAFLIEKVKEHDWSFGDTPTVTALVEKLA